MTTYELILPEFDLGGVTMTASNWLVDLGSPVEKGDRLLEVLADGMTIDLDSPGAGILAEILVEEDAVLRTGQLLARISAAG